MGICIDCKSDTGSADGRVKRCPKCAKAKKQSGRAPAARPAGGAAKDIGASVAASINALIERKLAESIAESNDFLDDKINTIIDMRLRRLAEDLAAAAKA